MRIEVALFSGLLIALGFCTGNQVIPRGDYESSIDERESKAFL